MFVLFFRCSFVKNTLSVKSLFRIPDSSIFIACPAWCRLEVHEVLALMGCLLCERAQILVTSCLSPAVHCRQHAWHYPSFQGRVTAQSCKGSYKRSKWHLLVARVCQVPNPSMTLYVITLQQPEDKLAFKAWKRFCRQQLLDGRKQLRGSLLATLNVITSFCSCGGWIQSFWRLLKNTGTNSAPLKVHCFQSCQLSSSRWVLVTLGYRM